jgi:hypothetical protein
LLVDHFDSPTSKKDGKALHLHFEEFNKPPIEHCSRILISKGFKDKITIQDLYLRGRNVFYILNAEVGQIKLLKRLFNEIGDLESKGICITEFTVF